MLHADSDSIASQPKAATAVHLALLQRLAIALLGLSIVLLTWHHVGMERTLEISGDSGYAYGIRDDSTQGGDSNSTLKKIGKQLVLDCTLRKGAYAWPFCGFYFTVGADPDGIDLSDFDAVTIDLQHEGPTPHVMRLYLRSFEPGFSRPGEWPTQKINEIEFETDQHAPTAIPLKLLRTAVWWNARQHVPLLRRDVQIAHVTEINLYTGGDTVPGNHRLVLKAIRFHGKLISQHDLFVWLVGVWIVFGLLWLLVGVAHHRQTIHLGKARLARLAGINRALELEARELAGQAYADPLTGALNRQGLRNLLMKQAATGSDAPCAVFFVDIDHFKRINDQFGHAVGDTVIRHFAATIQHDIRATDKLVRWGGEEFLIVCPGTDLASAQALGEKLRLALTLEAWPAAMRVTASFGITTTHAGEDFGAAIDRADKALYRAKHNGRNRVEVEDALPLPRLAHAQSG